MGDILEKSGMMRYIVSCLGQGGLKAGTECSRRVALSIAKFTVPFLHSSRQAFFL